MAKCKEIAIIGPADTAKAWFLEEVKGNFHVRIYFSGTKFEEHQTRMKSVSILFELALRAVELQLGKIARTLCPVRSFR